MQSGPGLVDEQRFVVSEDDNTLDGALDQIAKLRFTLLESLFRLLALDNLYSQSFVDPLEFGRTLYDPVFEGGMRKQAEEALQESEAQVRLAR